METQEPEVEEDATDSEVDETTDAEPETTTDSESEREPETEQGIILSADTLQDTLDSVGALVDECKIHFEDDHLAIRAVDPANVGMIDLNLESAAFESYNGNGETIGVNLNRLDDIASMADSGQLVHLTLDLEVGKMNIRIDGLTYNLALIDPNSIRQEPDVPDLDLPARISLETGMLKRGTKAADMVSDHITLAVDVDEEVFLIEAEGDTDDTSLELGSDDVIDLQVGEASSLYSLGYLQDMVKAIPKNAEVTIELGEDFPCKLHFDYGEGMGHTTYMLAPRIQSD